MCLWVFSGNCPDPLNFAINLFLVTAAILEWMRAQSRVVAPSICIASVAILHVPISYFFIRTLRLGLWGGAIAIAISHFLELLLSVMYICFCGAHKKFWVPWSKESFKSLLPVVQLAVPSLFMMIEWYRFISHEALNFLFKLSCFVEQYGVPH